MKGQMISKESKENHLVMRGLGPLASIFIVTVLLFPGRLYAHQGDLDSFGCHYNLEAVTYECHRGRFAGRVFAQKEDLQKALSFSGKVVAVTNAGMVKVMNRNRMTKVRLADIDSPEAGQPYWEQAKEFTIDLVLGEIVSVWVEDIERTGVVNGKVLLADGRDLTRELVRAGLAWWKRENSIEALPGTAESNGRFIGGELLKEKESFPLIDIEEAIIALLEQQEVLREEPVSSNLGTHLFSSLDQTGSEIRE